MNREIKTEGTIIHTCVISFSKKLEKILRGIKISLKI